MSLPRHRNCMKIQARDGLQKVLFQKFAWGSQKGTGINPSVSTGGIVFWKRRRSSWSVRPMHLSFERCGQLGAAEAAALLCSFGAVREGAVVSRFRNGARCPVLAKAKIILFVLTEKITICEACSDVIHDLVLVCTDVRDVEGPRMFCGAPPAFSGAIPSSSPFTLLKKTFSMQAMPFFCG